MPVLFVLIITVLVNFSSFALAQERTTKIRGPRSTDTPPAPLTIGPLSPSDTLWRVAERIKPDGNISLYQVMYALYLKNPDAFLENNLNHLRPGAVLVLPSLQEIQQVDVNTARDKSERDDQNWAARQKNAAAKQNTAAADKPAPSNDEAQKLQQELNRIDQQQRLELDSLRSQFADSMQQVEAIVAENMQLKGSLSKVEQELAVIKSQLGEDSELQQQISQLLAQQSELLQAKAEQEAQEAKGIDWQQWFKNPIAWVLAACIPALLVLFGILLWVKKRSRQTEEVIQAATTEPMADPSYQSPLPPLDDNNELDDSLFEIDDALLEDAFNTGPELADTDLSDELQEFDDALSFEDDSLLPADERSDKTPATEPEDAFDPDNILSDTDLSALLAAEDDDDIAIELADDEPVKQEAEADFAAQVPDVSAAADELEEQVLPDEFDVDELIEEIDLDEPDDSLAAPEQTQGQQLTEALSARTPSNEPEKSEPYQLVEDDVTDSRDTDLSEMETFDSSELEEFAESLVAEGGNQTSEAAELDNSEEALLSAELAELLDQVQDNLSEPDADVVAEEQEDILAVTDGGILDIDSQDELLDVTEPDEPDSALTSLDLTTADDASVTKPTDAALSVENPSKILDQYPQLELEAGNTPDEDSELSLPDDLEPELLLTDPDELSGEDLLSLDDDLTTEAELDPIPDTQFDSLMSELEAMADNLDDTEATESLADDSLLSNDAKQDDSFDFGDEDFVEIDSLLANAERQEQDPERFAQLNVDVGLEDYADIIGEHERRDVDSEDNGYSAKLDLVRAYIEIDDRESADLLLDDILASDAPENVKAEAQSLRK